MRAYAHIAAQKDARTLRATGGRPSLRLASGSCEYGLIARGVSHSEVGAVGEKKGRGREVKGSGTC
eukprot:scaffold89907_cov31-Tisochrysis_lutea.AAC.1